MKEGWLLMPDIPLQCSLFYLIDAFKKYMDSGERFCFILGAGASKQSGIRTGKELAEEWLREMEDFEPAMTIRWKKDHGIDISNASEHYSDIYEYRFRTSPKQGYITLEKEMENKSPSCGYYPLASILTRTISNLVITTNFDSLVEDSVFIYTDKKPLVITHESLAKYISVLSNRPIVAKIHRDLLLGPKSTLRDTNEIAKEWISVLTSAFEIFTPIVIGYGGNDGSVMGFLEALPESEKSFYWCYLEQYGLPNKRILELVKKRNGFLVPIEGFDETMILFGKKMACGTPTEHIQMNANSRIEVYNKQTKEILEKLEIRKDQGTLTEMEAATGNALKSESKNEIEKLTKKIQGISSRNYLLRGNEYYKLKKYQEAITDYTKAIEVAPNFVNAYNNRGNAYKSLQRYEEAIVDYSKAIELDSNDKDVYHNRGVAYNNMQRYKKAIIDSSKAIELDPTFANAYDNRGFAYNGLQRYEEAIVDYTKAIELAPSSANAYNNRGNAYTNLQKYEEAIDDYIKAIELDSNYRDAYNNRGVVYDNMQRYEEAIVDILRR